MSYLRGLAYVRLHRCSLLLGALCLFILVNPLLGHSAIGGMLGNLWLLVILMIAMWALRVRRLLVLGIGLLGLLTFLSIATDVLAGARWLRPLEFASAAVFMIAVTAALMGYVLNVQRVTPDKMYGAVATYVLIAFSFATLYGLLVQLQPAAFTVVPFHPAQRIAWIDLMYFSFTVLTSTGFGEITPASDMARALTVIEQVVGVMYVAFLIARLANLYQGRARRPPPTP